MVGRFGFGGWISENWPQEALLTLILEALII